MERSSSNRIVNEIDNFIQIGLMWDEIPGVTCDIDLQCVLLNEIGQVEDAVFYNQLESKIANIKHSGDSLGEKANFDEIISIDLKSSSFLVKYIAVLICSYNGDPLTSIESCSMQVRQSNTHLAIQSNGSLAGSLIHETLVGAVNQKGNSILACIFEKSFEGKWRMAKAEEVGEGRNFLENESLIKRGLVKGLGFDEVLFSECKNWSGGKSFALEKNRSLLIPPVIKTIAVGLGWDTNCDIDSSILLFDAQGNCLENIYFGNKISINGSVIHSGDNTTGVGDGDDEVIKINLNEIPPQVLSIWAVITIYSTDKQFDDVSGAYCRLFCLPTDNNKKIAGSEFCKYNLSENQDNISNGNIMCSITRAHDGCWTISPKGFYTKGTKTSSNVVQIVSSVMKNDFSQVQTIDQVLERFPHLKELALKKAREREHQQELQRQQKLKEQEIMRQRELLRPKLVELTIISASGLGSFDSNGLSDPYVIVYLNQKKQGKTEVVYKSLNPTWNYKLNMYLAKGDTIRLEIWDRDTFFDEFMGACFVHNSEVPTNLSVTLDVQDKHEKPSSKFPGTLQINIRLAE